LEENREGVTERGKGEMKKRVGIGERREQTRT